MSADPRPSYEELARENAELRDLAGALTARLDAVTARLDALERDNAELRRQLGQNSQNSSKPPSADGFAKPPPKSLRGKPTRKPGGQPGHPGSALEQVADPDEMLRHEPVACGGCGCDLARAPEVDVQRRQVFDLPPMTVRVTEHQLISRRCDCGVSTCAQAPAGVTAPASYGPRITAIILYLYVGQFLSQQRTAAALGELFGTPVSEGTVATMARRATNGLGGFLTQVADRIASAEVAGFDETGLRVASRLHWVHCARTDKYTLITCHAQRGKAGINAAGVLSRFHGVAVHDAWAPYDAYVDADHQLCCAHVLRELASVTETTEDGQWCWAGQAADALVAMQHQVNQAIAAGAETVDEHALTTHLHRYRSAAHIGLTSTADRSNPVMKRHHALARRLLDRENDYLRFTRDWRIPADNNGSERDIRMIKLRQKVSGCLRTLTGARQFCAIRSYLATAAKHGHNFFDALVMLTEGQPWLPETP